MQKVINLLTVFSLTLFASNIKPVKLEIYQNESFLTKAVFSDGESSFRSVLKIPYKLSLDDIEIEAKEGCNIKDIVLKEAKISADEITEDIEKLEKEIAFLDNKIKSLKENNKLLETLSLEKIDEELLNLKKIVEFQSSKLLENLNQIVLLNKKRESLQKELEKLRKKRESKFYKNLDLSIGCLKNSPDMAVTVKYPFNVKRRVSYDIYGDTKEKKLSIKSKLFLLQSSGEDLKNITVIYASYPKIRKIAPNPFYPWYVDVYPSRKLMMSKRMAKDETLALAPAPALEGADTVSYQKRETNEFYEVKNVTLISGVEKPLTLSEDRYDAKFFLEIPGYDIAKAFFTFEFDSLKFYNPSYAKFYLNDNFIGRRYFSLNKKKKQKLYFGEDLNLDVKKRVIKDFKEEPLFSSNKVKTTKIFEYKIKNDHNFPVNVVLVERSPISKNEKVEIKIISKPKYSDMKPNGKTLFEFSLSPKEEKKIEFGYEIEKPKP